METEPEIEKNETVNQTISEYDTVLDKLDDVAAEFMTTIEEILKLRHDQSSSIETGLLCMAKTRSSMGNKWVRAEQYDNGNMVADVKVEEWEILNDLGINYNEYELIKGIAKNRPSPDKSPKKQLNDDGLRKRGDGNTGVEDVDEEMEKLKVDDEVVPKYKDPITWFGVLVPQMLRQSQTCFKRALDISVKIASLHNKIKAEKIEYRKLMSKKKELAAAL